MHKSLTITRFAILSLAFWGIIVLGNYLKLIFPNFWVDLRLAVSSRSFFHYDKVGLPMVIVITFSFFALFTICYIVSRIFKINLSRVFIFSLVILTVLFLLLSFDAFLILDVFLFFCFFILSGYAAISVLRVTAQIKVDLIVGLLVSIICIHFYLFILAVFGVFTKPFIFPFVVLLCLLGIAEFLKNMPSIFKASRLVIDNLDLSSLILIYGLWIVILGAFVGASAPEIYSDAARSHVPYMINLVREGGFLPNYSWFGHLMSSPIQLTASIGYLFFGEIGASWFTFLLCISCVGLMISLISETIQCSLNITLGALLLFTSIPIVWIWFAANYIDIPTYTFLIAGLVLFYKALVEKPDYLPISALLWGFSITAKFNSIAFILIVFVVFSVFYRKNLLLLIKKAPKTVLLSVTVGLLTILPWYILVWYWTSNPFFPLFQDVFKSPVISYDIVSSIQVGHLKLFKFPLGWKDIFLWPWSATFHTNYFGEAHPGSMGPFVLIFYPVLLFFFFRFLFDDKKSVADRFSISIFCIALLWIYTLAALMGYTPYIRYWPISFALLAVSMSVQIQNHFNKITLNVIAQVLMSSFVVLISVLILFGWGARFTQSPTVDFGLSVFTGKLTKQEYLESKTGGIYEFINKNIDPGETVMAVGYNYLNTFDNLTYQLNTWNDVLIGLKELRDYDRFIKEKNVRYWAVNHSFKRIEYYTVLGIEDQWWRKDHLVYWKNGFAVYSTVPVQNPFRRPNDSQDLATPRIDTSQEFMVENGTIRYLGNGYSLRPTKEKAVVALKRLKKAYKNKLEISTTLTAHWEKGHGSNGFLLIRSDRNIQFRAGMFFGSQQYGVDGTRITPIRRRANKPIEFDKTYTLTVYFDIENHTARVNVNDVDISVNLPKGFRAVRYVGFTNSGAATQYGQIKITEKL